MNSIKTISFYFTKFIVEKGHNLILIHNVGTWTTYIGKILASILSYTETVVIQSFGFEDFIEVNCGKYLLNTFSSHYNLLIFN